jgi:tetratricopeptide (TPR) repeat protein
LDDYAAAMTDLDRAIGLSPEETDCYIWRGRVHARLGNLDGAIADFDVALRLAPDSQEAVVQRAKAERARQTAAGKAESVSAP